MKKGSEHAPEASELLTPLLEKVIKITNLIRTRTQTLGIERSTRIPEAIKGFRELISSKGHFSQSPDTQAQFIEMCIEIKTALQSAPTDPNDMERLNLIANFCQEVDTQITKYWDTYQSSSGVEEKLRGMLKKVSRGEELEFASGESTITYLSTGDFIANLSSSSVAELLGIPGADCPNFLTSFIAPLCSSIDAEGELRQQSISAA